MRLCDKCGKNPASVQIKKISAGKQIINHICLTCAVKMKIPVVAMKKYDNHLQFFLPSESDTTPCPFCKSTLEKIKKQNRIGCAHCFEHFNEQIHSVIKKIESAPSVTSEKPSPLHPPHGKPMTPNQKTLMLKSELAKAIQNNNFHLAEKLLQQLKMMETVKNV